MNKSFLGLPFILLGLAVLVLPGCWTERAAESAKPQSLVGIVYVTGNEPFINLALQTADGVMHHIEKDSANVYADLWKLQGRKVEIFYRLPLRKSARQSLIVERFRVLQED